MSTPRHITAAQALAAVWLTVLAASSHAAGGPHYYDGSQRRVVTLQPGLVAEFSRPGESRSFKSAYAGAVALAGACGLPRVPGRQLTGRPADCTAGWSVGEVQGRLDPGAH